MYPSCNAAKSVEIAAYCRDLLKKYLIFLKSYLLFEQNMLSLRVDNSIRSFCALIYPKCFDFKNIINFQEESNNNGNRKKKAFYGR